MEPKTTQRLHLNLPNSYHPQLKERLESLDPREVEASRRHNFENSSSLLGVEINWGLIKGLISKWDIIDQVFRFGTINLCPIVKEYSKILESPAIQNS